MRTMLFLLAFAAACHAAPADTAPSSATHPPIGDSSFFNKLSAAAIALTHQTVSYDPTYYVIAYPNGDIPAGKGVCSDVVIRAYRKLGIDLQKSVHEDMLQHFRDYPKHWGLAAPDKNIDHRRVPNLMTFFERKNSSLKLSLASADYQPGDIVCWQLPGNLTHIGLITTELSVDLKTHLVVHNIGGGQVMEDCLFRYKIIGHYRYNPAANTTVRGQ